MSLNDMKKRATLMVEYISKAQVDMAADRSLANRTPMDGGPVQAPTAPTSTAVQDTFKDMSSREMMDVLTRQITAWQKEYCETAPPV